LDVPVSGGFMGAHDGTLAAMVGGDRGAYERAKPVFACWATLTVHMGPAGAGTRTKLGVYVDTGQTGTSRTIVAPYSVRAHPGATVSTPLAWEELHAGLDPSRFTIVSVPLRAAEIDDPLVGFDEAKPDVPTALAALERWVKS
jgi:hypothetical protein